MTPKVNPKEAVPTLQATAVMLLPGMKHARSLLDVSIPLDDGAFRFVRPDGRAFDSFVPAGPSDWTQLPLSHDDDSIHIDRNTAVSRWRGERMDYGLGVEVLLAKDRRVRSVPAGTPA